jgi:DNA-binding transcriptional LysR family regulator
MAAKVAAQVAGLGVGSLPSWLAEREAAAGRLVILETAAPRPISDALIAWHPEQQGKGVKWFAQRLADPLVAAELLS